MYKVMFMAHEYIGDGVCIVSLSVADELHGAYHTA